MATFGPASQEVMTSGVIDIPNLRHLTGEEEAPPAMPAGEVEQVEEVKQEPEPEKVFENPHARARRLEREKRVDRDKIRSLETKLESMLKLIEERIAPVQPQEEQVEIDEENDPIGFVVQNQKKINKDLAEMRKQKEEDEKRKVSENNVRIADRAIQQELEENKEFDSAVRHLAGRMYAVLARENPDLDERQRKNVFEIGIKSMKDDFVTRGIDPVEQIYIMAEDAGWVYNEVEEPSKKPAARDERNAIRASKEKDSAAVGLGTATGRPAGKMNLRALTQKSSPESGASELKWKIDQLVKDGTLRPGDSPSRLPKMGDLLRGKGRPI